MFHSQYNKLFIVMIKMYSAIDCEINSISNNVYYSINKEIDGIQRNFLNVNSLYFWAKYHSIILLRIGYTNQICHDK